MILEILTHAGAAASGFGGPGDIWAAIVKDFSNITSPAAFSAFLQVLMIDIVLAGDNAIGVGARAAGLPADQRKKVILIDTAVLPGNDPALRQQLDNLAVRGLKAKNYLVLAATSQAQVLKAAYHSYKHCGLAGCILSKVDEAANLGEVLGLAISQHLPVAYLADGPKIPDDLQVPRSHQLVSRAVSMQTAEDPSEEAMADVFAGLYHHPARRAG